MTSVYGRDGMVASSQILASQAGLEILREGGTAADACLAMDAVLHVTEPTSTGLGGDMFALYFDATTGRITALNGSGRSALALDLERVRSDGFEALPRDHGHTVTVPGACAGWFDLNARYGSMPVSRLLAPAIRLAEEGFRVGQVTAAVWQRNFPQLSSPELSIAGRAPRSGELFRNGDLARVLQTIAADGASAFYAGEITKRIVAAVQRAGGLLTLDDFARHSSTWEEPISTSYRGVHVWECPPNGQGLAALVALNTLHGFAPGAPLSADRWHLQIEALRLGFEDCGAVVGDSQCLPPTWRNLLSERHGAAARARINIRQSGMLEPSLAARSSDTVYHCAVDAWGNACSFVSSHFIGFATGIVPELCGFVLQNRALGFVLIPGHPNAIGPGKRPYHTIMPGMLTWEDGSLWGAFGMIGGFMQPQGHVQMVMSLVDDEASPQQALEQPRFSILLEEGDGRIATEVGTPPELVAELRRRGHRITADVPSFGRALFGRGQIILRGHDNELRGGSDPRADGCALALRR